MVLVGEVFTEKFLSPLSRKLQTHCLSFYHSHTTLVQSSPHTTLVLKALLLPKPAIFCTVFIKGRICSTPTDHGS